MLSREKREKHAKYKNKMIKTKSIAHDSLVGEFDRPIIKQMIKTKTYCLGIGLVKQRNVLKSQMIERRIYSLRAIWLKRVI